MLYFLFLAAAFLLTGTEPAAAGPVVAFFAAVGSAIASMGVLGQLLVGLALTAAKTLLQMALQEKPKEPGITTDMKAGGDNALSVLMGAAASAGQLEYINTYGEAGDVKNAYLVQVISLSDLPVALTGLWIEDNKVTLPDLSAPSGDPRGHEIADYDGYVRIKFYDGTQTAPDTFLIDKFGADPDRPWSSDQIGRGVAYAILTAKFNRKRFNGIPQFLFETSGIKLYDVRKDSTAGGSGAHRWNTPATWEPSNNPAVQAYNIIRGLSYDGKWLYGGMTTGAAQLPAANWMAAANACDAPVALVGGGTEPRYRSGFEITLDQEPLDAIESIFRGCSGRLAITGTQFKAFVGDPVAAVYSFTDDQIIVTEEQGFDPFPGLEDTHNSAQASYPEPAEKWTAKDAPAYFRTDLEPTDDNRRLPVGLTFPSVPYAIQVQRLLQEAIRESRRFRVHRFCLPPEAYAIEPGDVVSWTSAWNSYTNKKFLVLETQWMPTGLQLVTVRECDPADYVWNPVTDQKPVSIGFIGDITPPPQLTSGWQALPATITDSTGTPRRPSIEVRFNGQLDDVEFVRVQVRVAGQTTLTYDAVEPYGDPAINPSVDSIILNGVFLPAQAYEVRGVYEPYSGRDVRWSNQDGNGVDGPWLGVVTPDVRLGIDDIYPVDPDVFLAGFRDWRNYVGKDVRAIRDELDGLGSYVSSGLYAGFSETQLVRTEVQARFDQFGASVTTEILAAAGPNSALAQQITTVQASLEGKASVTALSALSATVAEQGGQIFAQGDMILGLTTTVDGVSANGNLRFQTGYTPGAGFTSRFGLVAKVPAEATFREAGLYADVSASQARIILIADQIAIQAGGTIAAMFQAGTTFINAARINNLDAANITVSGRFSAPDIILNGSALTEMLAFDSITGRGSFSVGPTTLTTTGGWQTIGTLTINNPNPNPVFIDVSLTATVLVAVPGNASAVTTRLINVTTGTVLHSVGASASSGGSTQTQQTLRLDSSQTVQGNAVYEIQAQRTTHNFADYKASGAFSMVWWKR